jgi:hypothetical protein
VSQAVLCRRCGGADVALYETTYEHHSWDGVELVDGELRPTGEAIHSAGDVIANLTRLVCRDCEYVWRPRRPVGYPTAWDVVDEPVEVAPDGARMRRDQT